MGKALAKLFGKKDMRILMLGLDAAGKTSILTFLERWWWLFGVTKKLAQRVEVGVVLCGFCVLSLHACTLCKHPI